jgi:hypothetical protein
MVDNRHGDIVEAAKVGQNKTKEQDDERQKNDPKREESFQRLGHAKTGHLRTKSRLQAV